VIEGETVMSGRPLEVLVAGGGLGGLCLAQGLRRQGIQVSVYERDHSWDERADRYRLYINPAGARALRYALPDSAWERFLAGTAGNEGGFGFLDQHLRPLVVVEEEIMYPPSSDPGERAYPVDRRALRRAVGFGLDDIVNFGKELAAYQVSAGGRVRATFADGSSAEGDLLVGADGVDSNVRRRLLPGVTPQDTGTLGVGMRLPLTSANRRWLPHRLTEGMNLISAGMPIFLFTSVFERPASGPVATLEDDEQQGYLLCAFVARRSAMPAGIDRLAPEDVRRALQDLTTGWSPAVSDLLAACSPETIGLFPFGTLEPPLWSTGPVTLIGDAVHCMPPTGGSGANTALRDASLLARRLGLAAEEKLPLGEAVGGYEAEMRVYGSAAVRDALQMLARGLTTQPAGVIGMRAWFRLCAKSERLRRTTFAGAWWDVAKPRPWETAKTRAETVPA